MIEFTAGKFKFVVYESGYPKYAQLYYEGMSVTSGNMLLSHGASELRDLQYVLNRTLEIIMEKK